MGVSGESLWDREFAWLGFLGSRGLLGGSHPPAPGRTGVSARASALFPARWKSFDGPGWRDPSGAAAGATPSAPGLAEDNAGSARRRRERGRGAKAKGKLLWGDVREGKTGASLWS